MLSANPHDVNPVTYGAALKLWRHIFGGKRGILHLFTGKRDEADSRLLVERRARHFNYPDYAKAAAEWALEESAEGREVYFCAHLLTAPRRAKENAAPVGALYADGDGCEVPNGRLAPSALVESSPGRTQPYWKLTDPLPPETAERLNKRLTTEIGADPGGYDLSQLLRVPGTVNYKYPEHPVVKLVALQSDRAYTPRELDELLPKLEESTDASQEVAEATTEPPVLLDEEGMKVWRGERPKAKEDTGELDRSATLMKIGRVLYDAGATRQPIVSALEERDWTLGYDKYSGNRDGGRKEYERIYQKIAEEGRKALST